MQVKEEKMIDWTKIKNPAIADRVREEGRFMMQRCHFGVQGIAKTEQDVKLALDRLMQTGFKPMAFDTEMNFVPMLKELTQGEINLHCAVSYPFWSSGNCKNRTGCKIGIGPINANRI